MIEITPDLLNRIRNQMHCDIVQEATVRNSINGNDSEGVLVLTTPIVFENRTVSAVCCNTGLLLSTDYDTIVPYQRLSIEELDKVHSMVCNYKQHSFKPIN